jgi:alanyl-tRNA synthetase
MTSTLYYDDPELLEFDARVLGTTYREHGTEVELDRTAFYPEGGGQPADRGEIAGFPVVDVREEGGTIYHLVRGPLPCELTGTRVRAKVDPAQRRDYCQQHTGQHVLSGAFMAVGDYPTVSVHQGDSYTTIELAAEAIPSTDLDAVERCANEVIEADLPVTAHWATDRTIGDYPLRRPPKVSGSIRVIQIGDFDSVACGGIHVTRTGSIRLVRLYAVETIRGNVRTAWKIGDRAIEHYRETSETVARLSADLSAQPADLRERVGLLDQRVKAAELESRRLRDRIASLVAQRLIDAAEAPRPVRLVTAEFTDEPKDFLRGVMEHLVERTVGVAACLVNRVGNQIQWSVGMPAGSGLRFEEVRDDVLPIIEAKGGGRAPIWQGIGQRPDRAEDFLAAFRSAVSSKRDA